MKNDSDVKMTEKLRSCEVDLLIVNCGDKWIGGEKYLFILSITGNLLNLYNKQFQPNWRQYLTALVK